MAWAHRTHAMEQQILALSKDHPQQSVAHLVGCSAWTVHDVQRKYHWVARFGRQHVAGRRYAYDRDVWRRIFVVLYEQQRLSVDEVATRCRLHSTTVSRRMRDLGIQLRTPGESNRGTRRGRYHTGLRQCTAEGCTTGVRDPAHEVCAACRRRPPRRDV